MVYGDFFGDTVVLRLYIKLDILVDQNLDVFCFGSCALVGDKS